MTILSIVNLSELWGPLEGPQILHDQLQIELVFCLFFSKPGAYGDVLPD